MCLSALVPGSLGVTSLGCANSCREANEMRAPALHACPLPFTSGSELPLWRLRYRFADQSVIVIFGERQPLAEFKLPQPQNKDSAHRRPRHT
jgi:hypothetical protein